MSRVEALNILWRCFSHVQVVRIVFEHEPLIGGDVAKVVVIDEHLPEALGKNGTRARRAAIQSGWDIEVVSVSEWSSRKNR